VREAIASGLGSGARHITIRGTSIADVGVAVNSSNRADADWTIAGNRICRTDDSAVIVQGVDATVSDNDITNAGLDDSISYDKHGVTPRAAARASSATASPASRPRASPPATATR
jgi:hypothetical protein